MDWLAGLDRSQTKGLILGVTLLAILACVAYEAIRRRVNPTLRALTRARRGEIAEALADLKQIYKTKGESPALLAATGEVYLIRGEVERAVKTLQRGVELGKPSLDLLVALGWGLVRLGRYDEALKVAVAARKRRDSTDHFGAYCLYAGMMAHHGRAAEAQREFQVVTQAARLLANRPVFRERWLDRQYEFAEALMSGRGIPAAWRPDNERGFLDEDPLGRPAIAPAPRLSPVLHWSLIGGGGLVGLLLLGVLVGRIIDAIGPGPRPGAVARPDPARPAAAPVLSALEQEQQRLRFEDELRRHEQSVADREKLEIASREAETRRREQLDKQKFIDRLVTSADEAGRKRIERERDDRQGLADRRAELERIEREDWVRRERALVQHEQDTAGRVGKERARAEQERSDRRAEMVAIRERMRADRESELRQSEGRMRSDRAREDEAARQQMVAELERRLPDPAERRQILAMITDSAEFARRREQQVQAAREEIEKRRLEQADRPRRDAERREKERELIARQLREDAERDGGLSHEDRLLAFHRSRGDGQVGRPPRPRAIRRRLVNPDATPPPPPDAEGWTVIFRGDDPSIWNTDHERGDERAVAIDRLPATVRSLRLKRLDTGEAIVVPISLDALDQSADPASIDDQWHGRNNFDGGGYHLGIVQGPMRRPDPNTDLGLVAVGFSGDFWIGSGFGHGVSLPDGQFFAWRGKEIPKTAFEIAVNPEAITPTADAEPADPLTADADGWIVLFRGEDPAAWAQAPLDRVPRGIRALRLTRLDINESIIVPITRRDLIGVPSPAELGYQWNGSNADHYGARHLGIVEGRKLPGHERDFTAGWVVVALDGDGHWIGSGFGHWAYRRPEVQHHAWRGARIEPTAFEIAVTVREVTPTQRPAD